MGVFFRKTDPGILISNECWNTPEFLEALDKIIIDDYVDGKTQEELFTDVYNLHMAPLKEAYSIANSPHSGIVGKLLRSSLAEVDVESRVFSIIANYVPVVFSKYNIPKKSFAKKPKRRPSWKRNRK